MRRITSTIVMVALMGVMGVGMVACQKKGPAEKAGDAIDEALGTDGGAGEAGEAVDETVEDVKERVEDAKPDDAAGVAEAGPADEK